MAMPDTDDGFEKVSEFGPVTKFQTTVNTPMPSSGRGPSYTTEENRQVLYEVGEHLFKVSKVSSRGWTITHYDSDGLVSTMTGYMDDEEAIHEEARDRVEEVLND